jgi:hypothetical protein
LLLRQAGTGPRSGVFPRRTEGNPVREQRLAVKLPAARKVLDEADPRGMPSRLPSFDWPACTAPAAWASSAVLLFRA